MKDVSLSSPFIQRPVATSLLMVGIALAGAVGYRFLPIARLPEVDYPSINVRASLPGASPETMASSVATPLERQFGRIAGVTEMTSNSSIGQTSITLMFDLGRNIDAAGRDVQAAINAARGQLPANLPNNPSYRKANPADSPILVLTLTSDLVDRGRMYDLAASILQQKLAEVQGVGQVTIAGGTLPAVRVEVNPLAVFDSGLGLEDVRTVLSSANANRPKGDLENDDHLWSIASTDQLLAAAEYRPLVVAYRNGAAVRLGDIARVEDSVEDTRATGLSNGKPAIILLVFRQPGANIIATTDQVKALLPQLRSYLPPTVLLSVVIDTTRTIRASVHDVQVTLCISVALVILVVFLFLRSLRSTLIPSVAVPISLVGTFGVMYLLGYAIDNLSLMALTVATGFVVDDAIVVVENITRHLESGLPPMEAAQRGAREIGFTVLSISISLVAVFIPILLMGGFVGRLFREFAVTLSVAIAVSMFVSLTATPMMCARLLRPHGAGKRSAADLAVERVLEAVRRTYARALAWVLRRQFLMLTVTLATMVATVFLYYAIPKGFFPQQDTGRINGSYTADQDTSFLMTSRKLAEFQKVMTQDPAMESVAGIIESSANSGRIFASLKPREDRDVTADQIIARLRAKAANIPGATLLLQPVQDVRLSGRYGNAQYQYTLQGDDPRELFEWAPKVLDAMRNLPVLIDVSSDQQNKGLQAALTVDRATASRLGITPKLIDDTLYDAFGQRLVSTMYTPLNQYHVVMEVAPEFAQNPDALDAIHLRTANGGFVPLSAFAHYAPSTAPLAVNHQGQFPSVTISFNLPIHTALGTAIDAIRKAMTQIRLPPAIRGTFQGTAAAFQASLDSEPILILSALLAVYVVLGILYESLIHPLTILSTLPSAGVGALLALMLTGTELSVIALIGIILLIGIVKKNAILMIDFAIAAEREGKTPEEAIYQACLLRFRPITMTTMAALCGGLPLVLGGGTGSELRRPLGLAIVGGLVFSQMLTLFTTPVVYLYLDRLRLRWEALRGRAPRPRHVIPAATSLLVCLLLVTGCAAGPKYHPPENAAPQAWKEDAAAALRPAQPGDALARGAWWEVFDDPDLNALEGQLDVQNQTIAQAEARFRGARAEVRLARAGLYPTLDLAPAVVRSSGAAATAASTIAGTSSGPVTLYQVPVDFSWEVDVFGRLRRTLEANTALAQASAADLEAIRLAAHAELAIDYFTVRGLDAERELLDSTVTDFEKTLQLTVNRHDQGVVSGVDVAQAKTQLETTRADATDLRVTRAQVEHAIAVLLGKPPSEFSLTSGKMPEAPPDVPPGLPSDLLERRPDIAGAKRRIAAANAQIGIAKAAYFPTFTLAASGGYRATSLSSFFSLPNRFWSLGVEALETIFSSGRRRAVVETALAAYDENVAAYRQSVLGAFQEVEDNLAALRLLEEEAHQQADAVAAARELVTLARNRYTGGVTTYLEVATAQTAALANERAATQLLVRRMVASVNLVKAIGGGWDASDLPDRSAILKRTADAGSSQP